MNQGYAEISVKGEFRRVRAVVFNGLTVLVLGKGLKTASIKDEAWLDSHVRVDPEAIVRRLKEERAGVDIFHFSQRLPDIKPRYPFRIEWDNLAVIPIANYSDWWEHRLSQVTRKNVRRAGKKGIAVKTCEMSDELIRRIVAINNETRIRQGARFWHYGKSFEAVKKDYGDFLDRSEILGAFFGEELVGFLRLVYQGETASILQLLCMNKHFDRRPANALMAKAVERCVERGARYLIYGKYSYGRITNSSLAEFKRRNGFEKILVPAYDIPLTLKGRLALGLNVQAGLKRWIPEPVMRLARKARNALHKRAQVDGSGEGQEG